VPDTLVHVQGAMGYLLSCLAQDALREERAFGSAYDECLSWASSV
jgi:hypothetical protein